MDTKLIEELEKGIKGDVSTDEEILLKHSHDASPFEIKPQVVVFPKDSEDVKYVVSFVNKHKKADATLSITARAAGTDMSGGPINDSIILSFNKYMNKLKSINGNIACVEPGMFYRHFEKETLRHGFIFPTYPASKRICAIGGIVNNNSAGEKSLKYGNSINFIESLKVVITDGSEIRVHPLTEEELEKKIIQQDLEGQIYKKISELINSNLETIKKAKPITSKNSSGYYLWEVYDSNKKTFDLTKLFVGAQGTLGIVTEANLKLIPNKKFAEMLVIEMDNLEPLGEIINKVLPFKPDSFESYDDKTLKLGIKYFSSLAPGIKNTISTGLRLLPEFFKYFTNKLPKLVLQVEFTGDSRRELFAQISKLRGELEPYHLKTIVAPTKKAEKIFWSFRRESFNLLRFKSHDKHAIPFIDDIIVNPEYLVEFLPKLNAIFSKYPEIIYTVAGHIGDGNFHIIPLMDLKDSKQQQIIPKLGHEVYDLVLKYKGSIAAEHNDGLTRGPYVEKMYGKKVYDLFVKTKEIFDPDNIFNPRKKINVTMNYAIKHIRVAW